MNSVMDEEETIEHDKERLEHLEEEIKAARKDTEDPTEKELHKKHLYDEGGVGPVPG